MTKALPRGVPEAHASIRSSEILGRMHMLVWHQCWRRPAYGYNWGASGRCKGPCRASFGPSFFTVGELRSVVIRHVQATLTDTTELLYRHLDPHIPTNLKERGLSKPLWRTCSAASKTQRAPQRVVLALESNGVHAAGVTSGSSNSWNKDLLSSLLFSLCHFQLPDQPLQFSVCLFKIKCALGCAWFLHILCDHAVLRVLHPFSDNEPWQLCWSSSTQRGEDTFTASHIFKGIVPLLSLGIIQEDQVEPSYIPQRPLIVGS